MPNTRRLMRQVREILRLKYDQGLHHRAIARACGVGVGNQVGHHHGQRGEGRFSVLDPEDDGLGLPQCPLQKQANAPVGLHDEDDPAAQDREA